jgi:hypothetical protein
MEESKLSASLSSSPGAASTSRRSGSASRRVSRGGEGGRGPRILYLLIFARIILAHYMLMVQLCAAQLMPVLNLYLAEGRRQTQPRQVELTNGRGQ